MKGSFRNIGATLASLKTFAVSAMADAMGRNTIKDPPLRTGRIRKGGYGSGNFPGYKTMTDDECSAAYLKLYNAGKRGRAKRFLNKWLRAEHMRNVLCGKPEVVHPKHIHPRHLRVKPA